MTRAFTRSSILHSRLVFRKHVNFKLQSAQRLNSSSRGKLTSRVSSNTGIHSGLSINEKCWSEEIRVTVEWPSQLLPWGTGTKFKKGEFSYTTYNDTQLRSKIGSHLLWQMWFKTLRFNTAITTSINITILTFLLFVKIITTIVIITITTTVHTQNNIGLLCAVWSR